VASFDAGSEVSGYRLEVQLGSGGFGSVWRAQHLASGRTVALKVLAEAIAQSASGLLRHEIEVLAGAAAQSSEHLVRVLDGGVSPVPYIVMEYIDGADLRAQLSRLERLPVAEAIRIGQGVADALRALHEMGVIHRDVKPANIMIDRRGVVKLTDFGIAKIVGYHDVTATGQNPLSAPYAAPEVWEQSPTPGSDIYALGVLLFECVVGRRPFEGSPAALVNAHLNRAPDLSVLPPDAPPSLVEVIGKSLAKDQIARPVAAEALALLDAAARESAEFQANVEPEKHEPERFGVWSKERRHESIPWAWHCLHRDSGENAVVEIRFAADLAALSAQLAESRRALDANPKFVPLGAERLLDVDRLLLRPGETWPEAPPGPFYYLVARQEPPAESRSGPLSPDVIETTAESLKDLIEMAHAEGIDLNLAPEELSLQPDGSVRVRHPGLPAPYVPPMEDAALTYIAGLPLTPESREVTGGARTLDDVLDALKQRREEIQPGPDLNATVIADLGLLSPTPGPATATPAPPAGVTPSGEPEPAQPPEAEPTNHPDTAGAAAGAPASVPPPAVPAGPDTAGTSGADVYTTSGFTGTHVAPGFEVQLRPARTSTRFRSALFELMIFNRTDESRMVSLGVEADPAARVSLPSSVMLGPRQERRVAVKARPSRRRWFGGRQPCSFSVVASGDGQPPRRVDGTFSDDSMGWLPLGAGGGLLGVGGVALALFLAGGDGGHPPVTPTATTGAAVATRTQTPTPTLVAGSTEPEGLLAFESNREDGFHIYVMEPDGTGVTRLTEGEATDYEPAWSPDASQIVFAQSGEDDVFDLFVMNADGSGPTQITDGMDAREPVWSPDGSRIAFYSNVDGNDDIYLVDAGGSVPTRLTSNSESDIRPAWSPDGSRIAFSSLRFGNWDVYVMNSDGSGLTRITDDPAFDWAAAWSPDGSQLAFVSDRGGVSNLYLMNPDGSGVRPLTSQDLDVAEPSWSPDGSYIAFAVAGENGNRDIYVVEVVGGDLTRLTDSEDDDDGWPAWSPPAGGRQAPRPTPTATPTPSPIGPPTATPTVAVGGILFSDDFEDPSDPDVEAFEADFYRSGYADGEFVIEQFNPGAAFFAAARLPGLYKDAYFAIDARVIGDPADAVIGLACRLQDTDGYRFVVRPQTRVFAIERVLFAQVEVIYPHTESASISTDINRLEMACVGNTITVWANGNFLASVTDDTFSQGDLFIATTAQDGFIEARFDNLIVLQQ